ESSLVAYFRELVDIVGHGSKRLSEKLSMVNAGHNGHRAFSAEATLNSSHGISDLDFSGLATSDDPLGLGNSRTFHEETLQHTSFWKSKKPFQILPGPRHVYLEAASSELLTLRPPHNANSKLDLINGHFVMEESRR